jgi:hypothetical protein
LTSKHTEALTALTLPSGGRLLIGHVSRRDRHDPSVPVPAFEYRWPAFYADATCQHCPSRSELSLSEDGTEALLLVIHRDDCPQLAEIRAGLARAAQ